MFTRFAALVGLSLILALEAGGAIAAPNAAVLCQDPAVLAAIDSKETAAINGNRLPGSGLLVSSLPALSGIQFTNHWIEPVGGQTVAEPNVAVCRVKIHLQAMTPNGVKAADDNFTYRIERLSGLFDVRFCPNGDCAMALAPGALASRAQ